MLTIKSATVAILALLCLLLGVSTTSSLLIIASIPLFAFLALSLIFSLKDPDLDLEVKRTLEKQSVYEDEACRVTLAVTNNGHKIDYLELTDKLQDNLVVAQGSNFHIISLERGETFTATYIVKPKIYGYFKIGPVIIRASDILGTSIITRIFQASDSLRVLPKIGYIRKIDIRPKKTRNWPGEIVSRKVGAGLEFYSLRDYSPGDPVRRINWKASSKQEERIYTNQFMSELGGDTIIVLDARTDSEVGKAPESTITYSIRAAAIVSYRLLRDRNRVGMVSLGSSLEKVFPGFGKRQFDRIQIALSHVKSGSTWDIRGLGFFLGMFFSTTVQIVVLSSLKDKASFETILDIARRGYRVIVISPSPVEIQRELVGKNRREIENYDLALRLLRAQRQNRLNELRQVAIVADWNVKLPLSDALQEVAYHWKRQGTRER